MKIKSTEVYNTGGNCMVHELPIEGGGELASIAINEECIIGYDAPYFLLPEDNHGNVLWVVTESCYLNMIPEEIRADVIHAYHLFREKYNIDYDLTKVISIINGDPNEVVVSDILESYLNINEDVLTDEFKKNLRTEVMKQKIKEAMERVLDDLLDYVDDQVNNVGNMELAESNVEEILKAIDDLN